MPDDLTLHDIRGSAITRLAETGCEVPEIATITGHSLRDVEAILDAHYLGRTTKLPSLRSPSWSESRRISEPMKNENCKTSCKTWKPWTR